MDAVGHGFAALVSTHSRLKAAGLHPVRGLPRGLGFNTQVFLHMVKDVLTCFLNKLFSKFKFTFQEKSFLPLFPWQPELLGKANSH